MSSSFRFEREARRGRRGSRGFTLLELVISIALLSVISLAIYRATTDSYRIRDSLAGEGDFQTGIRLSLGIVDRDFSLLFSPLPLAASRAKGSNQSAGDQVNQQLSGGAAYETDAAAMAALDADLERPSRFWGAAVDATGLRPSRFQGDDKSMSFVSASHIRLYKDTPETEFAKIRYSLEENREARAEPGSRVLVRREDPNAFDLDDRNDSPTERIYPLLRGITEFTFRYFDPEKNEWVRSWDSDSEETKNRYPTMIEIKLSVKQPPRQFFEGLFKFKRELPIAGIPTTF